MARNNITRVPPPTNFFGTLDVTAEYSDDVRFFTSINDAIDFLLALPIAQNPLAGIFWGIRIHSGINPDTFQLPINVSLFGVSPIGTFVTGGSDVQTGDAVISVKNASIANIIVQPDGITGNPESLIFVQNSLSVYTAKDSSWTSLDGLQLKITPEGENEEIFNLGGEITDANGLANEINNSGVNLGATVTHNMVQIIGIEDAEDQPLTVNKTGTANAALGFSSIVDETSVPNEVEFLVIKELILVGSSSIGKAIYFSDDGGGQYAAANISTFGTQYGIYFEEGSVGIIRTAFPALHSTAGVLIKGNASAQFEGGSSKNNIMDVIIEANGELIARAFTYTKILNEGILIPSGSRITFEWNITGVLGVGTFEDGARAVPYDMTIESVQFVRGLNGSGGSTIIDINKGISGASAITLYTTQGNRPTINASASDNSVILATLPDILRVAKGYYLSMDVDQIEDGAGPSAPANLHVIITGVVN